MRFITLAAIAALLAACSPPSNPSQNQGQPEPQPPLAAACNAVTPDLTQAITLGDEVAMAATVADLRGGRVAPGTYDLISGSRLGGAIGWQGARAVALQVTESEAGTLFDWASTPEGGGDTERWSAGFMDAPQGHLTFLCGREGGADVDFTAEANGLRLQLPEENGAGSLYLVFARRS